MRVAGTRMRMEPGSTGLVGMTEQSRQSRQSNFISPRPLKALELPNISLRAHMLSQQGMQMGVVHIPCPIILIRSQPRLEEALSMGTAIVWTGSIKHMEMASVSLG